MPFFFLPRFSEKGGGGENAIVIAWKTINVIKSLLVLSPNGHIPDKTEQGSLFKVVLPLHQSLFSGCDIFMSHRST